MRRFCRVGFALAAGALLAGAPARAAAPAASEGAGGATVVLVHGAWETASSWSLVAAQLRARAYRVVAPEIPLRTLAGDAAAVADVVKGIDGPVVLVGHSYGGAVISNAVSDGSKVRALVFIAAFAPDRGESILALASQVPGSLVAASLVPVPFTAPAVGFDLYINSLLYRSVFAADLPEAVASQMAATQRPLTLDALSDPSGAPAWKSIASWSMVARNDLAIPPATERFMAARARATTVEVASSHAAPVSQPDAVTDLIVAAAGPAQATPAPLPAVSRLRLSPSAFRAARAGPAVRAPTVRIATRVSYALSAPATVRLTVQRLARGRSAGGRCAAPAASNRGQPACTRVVAVRGAFTRSRPAGPDRFTFTGRLAGRALPAGSYRLLATPTADGRSGAPARAPFRIVR